MRINYEIIFAGILFGFSTIEISAQTSTEEGG